MPPRKGSAKGKRPTSGSRTRKGAAAPPTRSPSPPARDTPPPPVLAPQPSTPKSKRAPTLLASTPKGEIYDNPPGAESTPPGSPQNQNSEESDNDEDLADPTEPEPEPEATVEPVVRAATYRTREQEARRMTAADNLALVVNEKKMEKQRKWQVIAQSAVLGYCAFPLAKPSASINWGKYNPRNINPAKSALLRANMDLGLNNCDPQTVIRIGMKKDWYEGELVKDIWGMTVLDIPQWKLTPAGMKALKEGKIVPFSGNHRRHALIGYEETVRNRVKAMENEIKRFAPKGPNALDANALKTLAEKKKNLATLEELAEKAKLWAAQIYDLGN